MQARCSNCNNWTRTEKSFGKCSVIQLANNSHGEMFALLNHHNDYDEYLTTPENFLCGEFSNDKIRLASIVDIGLGQFNYIDEDE